MKITLIRHAEVIKEYQGKYNGHIDIPISKSGEEEAKKLATKLKNEKFDKIFCSDLLRAKQTLKAFDLDIEPIYTDKLREKSWGIHEGKSFDEIETLGIEYINFEQWISELDGENIQDYQDKIKNYFFETIFKQKKENILVVTHAGAIRILLKIIKNLPYEEAFCIKIPYLGCVVLELCNDTLIDSNINIKNFSYNYYNK